MFAKRWAPSLFLLLTCLAHVAPPMYAQGTPVCAPAANVQSALDQVPSFQTADQFEYDFLQARRSAILTLRQRYPGDVFVQRAYIGSMSNRNAPADRLQVIAEYRALHERRPDDGYLAYLYGTTLLGRDTPRAAQLFADALEKAPNFPWPHLQLVSIYSAPNFLDKAKAIAHAKAFLAACPATLEGYSSLSALGDDDLIRQAAAQLRPVLESRTDPEALGAYRTLWSFEFAAHPPAAYDGLRKQVAIDVARVRALNRETVRQWWEALEEGYQLTNDGQQSLWAAEEGARRFPSNRSLPERTRWYEARKFPGLEAPEAQRKAYYRDLLQQTDAWIRLRPNSYAVWFDRLQALVSLDDSPVAEVEACIAKMLALAHADKGPAPLDSVTDLQLVYVLYNKKLQPQRQLELAQQALEQYGVEYNLPPDDRYTSKRTTEDGAFWRTHYKALAYFYQADAHVRLKQARMVQEVLEQEEATLRALKSQVNDRGDFRKAYARQESFYWLGEARLAELEGHQADAMAYYQSALLARLDTGSVPAPGEKDDLAHDAHRLWAGLGGSEEGWKHWYTRRAEAVAEQSNVLWESARTPLPPFQLADLQGKTWRSADLKGKVVFLNFWASW